MRGFIPSKAGMELFELEAKALTDLIFALSDKIENSPGMTREEFDFWIEKLKILQSISESDVEFIKLSARLAKQALLN